MSDKNNYIFYKIECIDKDKHLRYVGSTYNWEKRMGKHKSDCNNENSKFYNNKKYKIIRDNGGWDNFEFIEIGAKEEITKNKAHQIEENYRISLNANMNSVRCYRTEEQKREYKQDNKERNKLYNQLYREKYSEEIKESRKGYLSLKYNCECGSTFRFNDKARHFRTKCHQAFVGSAGVEALTLSAS
tara:strand:+ start:28 stop:588 length:561 start_codon:yes stop_codon:yes gene_type:complete